MIELAAPAGVRRYPPLPPTIPPYMQGLDAKGKMEALAVTVLLLWIPLILLCAENMHVES